MASPSCGGCPPSTGGPLTGPTAAPPSTTVSQVAGDTSTTIIEGDELAAAAAGAPADICAAIVAPLRNLAARRSSELAGPLEQLISLWEDLTPCIQLLVTWLVAMVVFRALRLRAP